MDGRSTVALFEMGLRSCMDVFGSDARFRQFKRERHGEAFGMDCAEQLLRVRALALANARPEVVWTVKGAAPKAHVSGTLGQISTPFCVGRSDCHLYFQRIEPDVTRCPVGR